MFPRMLDQYQIQLTRMLEAEQYREAKGLLNFLLQCQGEDKRHYEEWGNLLTWLEMAFPSYEAEQHGFVPMDQASPQGEAEDNEDALRKQALVSDRQDDDYVAQVLYIMQNHPIADQQILALERAAHLDNPVVDETILSWLDGSDIHPALQFKALQCLRRRGHTGTIRLNRLGEQVELELDGTPLSMDDFPPVVTKVVERVESITEVIDATMPHFARELWKECIQCFYGTSAYVRMKDDEETIDCYAAALHQSLELTLYGRADDDDIRDTYGITDSLRFRYEQACRTLRHVVEMQDRGEGEEP
nr:WbqC family protein [Paenibacillus oenotherae]